MMSMAKPASSQTAVLVRMRSAQVAILARNRTPGARERRMYLGGACSEPVRGCESRPHRNARYAQDADV